MDRQIKNAYNTLNANLDYDKFSAICAAVPDLKPQAIAEFIDADWSNADEHSEWLQSAPATEIAGWVEAGQS